MDRYHQLDWVFTSQFRLELRGGRVVLVVLRVLRVCIERRMIPLFGGLCVPVFSLLAMYMGHQAPGLRYAGSRVYGTCSFLFYGSPCPPKEL